MAFVPSLPFLAATVLVARELFLPATLLVEVWAETWERNARGRNIASSDLFIEHASLR
jgi:hypothetical protein